MSQDWGDIHKTLLYIIDAKHLIKSTYPIYIFLFTFLLYSYMFTSTCHENIS